MFKLAKLVIKTKQNKHMAYLNIVNIHSWEEGRLECYFNC